MKQILHLLFIFLLSSPALWAQSVPQGMRYQAVARDTDGNLIENQRISLKISLKAGEQGDALYQEAHHVMTNHLGLFSITIGEGKSLQGEFASIPWSVAQIWLDIEMDETGGNKFVHINSSQLLAVPYAFHAGTAGQVLNDGNTGDEKNGGLQFYWSINGNIGTFPHLHSIGTRDNKDLNFRTNDQVRLTITAGGEIDIKGDLDVGDNLNINNNLSVGNDAVIGQDLRVERDLSVGRDGLIENDFRIDNDLSVGHDGLVENNLRVDNDLSLGNDGLIENNLRVDNDFSVGNDGIFEGDLEVQGNGLFKNQILLDNGSLGSTSPATGALVVAGGVGIGQNLNVGGAINSNSFNVTGNSTNYVATFTNTNTGNGDGIAIKLGRNHPLWNGTQFNNVQVPWVQQLNTQINTIEGWVKGDPFQPTDLLSLFPATIQAGMALTVVNVVTQELNDLLNLPITIGPINFPGFTVVPEIDLDPFGSIGPYGIPSFQLFPQFTAFPSIPEIPISTLGLPTLDMPTISFTNVTNSLTNQNEYIKFFDQADRQVGSIRAQSIENWELSFLDGVFFTNVLADLVGIDFVSGAYNIIKGFTNVTDAYNKIGVEYVSGHGDYAEWLPRLNENEHISTGDIVGIKGGKISKNLEGAEQILAISEKPIILGNAPEEGKEYTGNKVAFLGQIPVKIIGPVQSGDYVIAKSNIPGYGVAVKADALTLEDIPLIVGRSWDNHNSQGPKMINTIIGLNKNDMVHILARELKKIDDLEARVTALEKTFDVLNVREQAQMSFHKKSDSIGK